MDDYTIRRDNQKDLKFSGLLLAAVEEFNGPHTPAKHRTWKIFKTESGKFIGHKLDIDTLGCGYEDSEAQICESNNDLIEFFGLSELAKNLYRKVGIEVVKVVP